ncbi:2-amino-4-hydroxy-6-hydroxymethyldihydropteridine diphosphokinase [Cryobacterium sp. PH29-G1]|uniref:2-amino-4-hydroxy-6- hydroxymethyldihydropteridine diphosphokinase n=1 Tax=Cryobacterium sp. PH29-G1 TaxID=3046211 RepID=UPI0024BB3671|nr:2-amino-4-hydroxy-6-hydroxymethyldihydropteridine diphosphokinase [Cryobacterium sp. PH29-G1]MDJ0349959.1 2-amino-4-hydroxy-6-hydroxymethyldihydropteridine diphosphokinase [Cryobacterium sp. PH29-G1]
MTGAATRVVLALGSNLGDRAGTLTGAVRDLAALPGAAFVALSPVYESAAVKLDGVDETAPRYLNAVLTMDYIGDPHTLLHAVNAIEAEHGRVRAERWGDRTLDIDLIVFGQMSVNDERLTLPHPRAAERDFVLAPWLDLDADAAIPGRGLVRDLLAATANTVRRIADATPPDSAPSVPR